MNKEKLENLDIEIDYGEYPETTEKERRDHEIEEIEKLVHSIQGKVVARGKNIGKKLLQKDVLIRGRETIIFLSETGTMKRLDSLSGKYDFDFKDKNFTDAIDTLKVLFRLEAISASLTNETIS